MDAEWPELTERMLGAGPSLRGDLQLQICAKVVKMRDSFGPAQWRGPQPWSHGEDKSISQLRALAGTFGKDFNFEAFRVSAEATPALAFTRWRNAVHDHEASEAGRLSVVVWTYQTLYRLRNTEGVDPRTCERAATLVGDVLEHQWRCSAVPLEGDYRAWAAKQTRRLDLLPVTWRYV